MEEKNTIEEEKKVLEEKISHFTALTFAYRTIGVSVDMKDSILIEKISDFVKGKTMSDIKLSDIDEIIKESNHEFEQIISKSKLV